MRSLSSAPTHRRRWAILAIVAVVGLVAAACSDDADESTSTSTASTTDESSPAAEAEQLSDRGGYADTPWPSEHADRWRTHAVRGGLPEDVTSEDLVATTAPVPAVPQWGYTKGDHVYVIGGQPATLGIFTNLGSSSDDTASQAREMVAELQAAQEATPYVAKIDPATMTAETVELTEGSTFNYSGGLLMHENGSIYAVSQSVLYRINPDDLTVEDTLELPILTGADGDPVQTTTYNSIQVRSNGDLILKSCDITGRTTGGALMLIDPDTLEITAQTDSSDVATARLTMAIEDGRELIYHSSPTESLRFEVTDDGFELDEAWTASYRSSDDSTSSQASSPVYMGGSDAVVFANNTLPFGVTTPMLLFSQVTNSDPDGALAGDQLFEESTRQVNFFMVAGDPFKSNVVVQGDQVSGYLAGWRLGDDGELTRLWNSADYKNHAGLAIAYEQGHLYTDDRRCDDSGENCTTYVVVLDLETGEHIAEVEVAGSVPTSAQMFVGEDAVYYIASEVGSDEGFVTRVAVDEG